MYTTLRQDLLYLKSINGKKIYLIYNERRPSWALNYNTPNNYYKRFMNGEIEDKKTYENRILSETPKFVIKRMSTFID